MFKADLSENQITPESVFWQRRRFIKNFAMASAAIPLAGVAKGRTEPDYSGQSLKKELSSEYVVTHHNNFYEFSTDKKKPSKMAKNFNPGLDWKIKITGAVNKPGDYTLEDIFLQSTTRRKNISTSLCRGVVNGGSLARFRIG